MGSQISADPCLIFRAFGGILSLTTFPWCLKLQLLLQGQCLAPQLSGQQSVLWGGRTKIEWGEGGRRNPKYSITQTRTLLNLPCSCAPQICPLMFPLFTPPTYSPCHSLVLASIIFTPTTTIFPLKTLYLLHNIPYLPPLPLHKFAHHPIFVPLIIHLPIHFTSVSKVPILILTPTAPIICIPTPNFPPLISAPSTPNLHPHTLNLPIHMPYLAHMWSLWTLYLLPHPAYLLPHSSHLPPQHIFAHYIALSAPMHHQFTPIHTITYLSSHIYPHSPHIWHPHTLSTSRHTLSDPSTPNLPLTIQGLSQLLLLILLPSQPLLLRPALQVLTALTGLAAKLRTGGTQ